jgi:probable addiction module antidote protein
MNDQLTEDYDDIIAPNLRSDSYVTEYLNQALNDPDPRLLLLALRRVAKARGVNMGELAAEVNLTSRGVYNALSEKGNPEWSTLSSLLDALGFQLTLTPKKAS